MSENGVASGYAVLADDGVFDVVIEEKQFDLPGDREERLAAIQGAYNEIIGSWVRKHSEQRSGWFHHRFRPYLDYTG